VIAKQDRETRKINYAVIYFQYLKYTVVENLCSEILITEPRSTFQPKNIFVERDTILSSSPIERKQMQLSVYHCNDIIFFYIKCRNCDFSYRYHCYHMKILMCQPFLKSLLWLLKFQTRTHIFRKWCHVIWQTDTNVAQETAASIYSSQPQVKCVPCHCLITKYFPPLLLLKIIILTSPGTDTFLIPFFCTTRLKVELQSWFLS